MQLTIEHRRSGFFVPVPKHPALVGGVCRLGRACYWLGVIVAVAILLIGLAFGIDGAGHRLNQAMFVAEIMLAAGVIAAVPFSIGRGLRYVLSGE